MTNYYTAPGSLETLERRHPFKVWQKVTGQEKPEVVAESTESLVIAEFMADRAIAKPFGNAEKAWVCDCNGNAIYIATNEG